MGKDLKIRLYIVAIFTLGIVLGTLSVFIWSLEFEASQFWIMPALTLLLAAAGRFPFKVSPQGDATLVTVPMFISVLLLHPLEAGLVVVTGTLISEASLKAKFRVGVFNVGVNGLVTALAGIVFWSLRPESGGLFDLAVVAAAIAAGIVNIVTGTSLLFVMITILKGGSFWHRWKESWLFELILDSSQLAIGLIGALLVSVAGWTLIILTLPIIVAYYAFSRSVKEVVQKTELAEELDENLRELKETHSQLIQSAKLATVGTLAAGIAHDINNPLTIITGRSEIMLAKLNASQGNADSVDLDKVASSIKDVHNMAMRISNIVNQLLSYSRRSEESTSKVMLHTVIDESLPLLERKFEKKNIELVKNYEQTPTVSVVSNQLQQVFMNLVGNAIDAMPENGTITLGCTVENGVAVASVKDSGTGIPQEVLDKIFEPFFTTKEVGKGTGLGLFICHKIVTDHGGQLTVESKLGIGTTFYIKLPLVVDSEIRQESGLAVA